ncbi:MAG: 30S ribosomal protein S3 [Promethearchaeia archaeon]
MPLAKKFIENGIKLMQINEYLRSELDRAGFAGIDFNKTPLGVRITLRTSRPGLVIGKGGSRIREITEELKNNFGLEMPQIEVEEVKRPDLNAQIMAERLAYSLDRGRHYRRAGYYILRKIMDAGALGAEITISGKVTSQRSRTQIFRSGIMTKSGHPAQEAVDKGLSTCIQKSGVLGIIVKILHSDYVAGDEVKIKHNLLEKAQKEKKNEKAKKAAKAEAEAKAEDEEYEIEEEERELTAAERELFDDIDEEEEDIKEISLKPSENEDEEEKNEEESE